MSQAASRGIQTSENGETNSINVEPDQPLNLRSVYAPIESELESVESILRKELSSETPFVDQLLKHSWLLGGKRIRPALLLLSAASCGKVSDAHLQMAAALEMIHTATLVHDDVLDDAKTRRHRATANSTWGNKVSVLLGDYLFTHSFHVASLSGSAEALRMLAQASNLVCAGEMRQNAATGDFDLSQSDYLRIISEKTAELCSAACRIGAFLSDGSPELVDEFAAYGTNLGVAFQIIDDVLDVVGHPEKVGKTLGTDLLNQKPTLPIIHCLENLNESKRTELKSALVNSSATTESVMPFLISTGSLIFARNAAHRHALAAQEFCISLKPNPCSVALQNLAEFVLERTH